MNHYKSIATRMMTLFDENEKINLGRIASQQRVIDDLEYKLRVSEARLSQTKRQLDQVEKQKDQALKLLDTNQYRI